ncbi:AraC family transcriptional regulator [Lederbergia lenta]|uniref:AraC family transcriptional regulator n=2 Tax=Lederbergia lenta TaxID=1467 RepID=A0A2X4W7S7_LEDLE|nr:helix-turn-helix domain-containing protein [Lederbergia lenta]MCM3110374.1 helix-turn-helix domain-containing protein [Lederbergia lenta]MEC2324060.1 helix-turn-helix domain-containing protein [Lederbergia lenta]SQI60717.1 AraC family transcriptional regulator [Lederbergia lenta]
MQYEWLDKYLRELDSIERIQIKTKENINDFDGNELLVEAKGAVPRMQDFYFFDKGPIFINKHHRFADMPLHVHSFIEINYVYSGICRQMINGKEVLLKKGQVCLLDTDVPHSILALGSDDILVNIIMKKETFSTAFWSRFSNKGLVSDFLMNAISENQQHDRYILFHSQENENLQWIIKNMLYEFFAPQDHSTEMINAYLPIMFIELMRVYQLDKNFESKDRGKTTSIVDILHYIEENFRNCTLSSLANTFNFNANYLSNMLKEQTGKSFLELIQMQRMVHAASLLKNTNKSIDEIANHVGYESTSFFHRKFKEYFNRTPNRFRNNKN